MHNLGRTRSSCQRDHLLLTADTFVRTVLPGMINGTAVVHVSPAVGAGFTQYTAELETGGSLGPTAAQRFVYVLSGGIEVESRPVGTGGYVYLPAAATAMISTGEGARLAVIEKAYRGLEDFQTPPTLVGDESHVTSTALMGDEDLQVRSLLPDRPEFDFAVNTMTYEPGASLSMVEIHVMEHGLLMLEGGGIYRLGDAWYPVTAGDFIWMAPFCPQWFGALGKQPAKYLIYKDWNRHPLG